MAEGKNCKCPDKGDRELISVGKRLFEAATIKSKTTGATVPKYVFDDWPYEGPPDPDGRTKIDCTHMLHAILKAAGYSEITYFSTKNFLYDQLRAEPNQTAHRPSEFFCYKPGFCKWPNWAIRPLRSSKFRTSCEHDCGTVF